MQSQTFSFVLTFFFFFFFLIRETVYYLIFSCVPKMFWKIFSCVKQVWIIIIIIINFFFQLDCVGPKNLATPAHFISSPRPMPRRKKCPRTNEEGPNYQETLPRTILFSANRDHRRRKRHATKGSLPERPKASQGKAQVQWDSHVSIVEG